MKKEKSRMTLSWLPSLVDWRQNQYIEIKEKEGQKGNMEMLVKESETFRLRIWGDFGDYESERGE